MLTARPGETIPQLKARMMATNDAAYQSRQRPNESRKGNFKFAGSGTGDAENAVSIGVLPAPDEGSRYELRDLESGEIEIVLISDVSEGSPLAPTMAPDPSRSADRTYTHRLHTSNDPQLRKMNQANKDFWKRTRK